MKVIAVSSAKGGVGKSTICVHLAVAAEAAGLAAAIFDLDPQASVALWSDHRGEPVPAVVAAQAPRLRGLLKQALERGADLVLLDTPPHASGVSADACALSDAVLIPCRPSAFDLDSVGASIRVATAASRPCWVVINAAPTQGTEVAETHAALQAAGVKVAPVTIHQRKAYSARAHEGRTALEIEPGGKAAREIEALLAWLSSVAEFPLDQATKVERNPATKTTRNRATRVATISGTRVARTHATKGLDKQNTALPKRRGPQTPENPVTKGPRSRATSVTCQIGSRVMRYGDVVGDVRSGPQQHGYTGTGALRDPNPCGPEEPATWATLYPDDPVSWDRGSNEALA